MSSRRQHEVNLTLRIRTQIGTWRIGNVRGDDTVEEILCRVCSDHHAELLPGKPICRDAGGTEIIAPSDTVGRLGLQNGEMLYATINAGECSCIQLIAESQCLSIWITSYVYSA